MFEWFLPKLIQLQEENSDAKNKVREHFKHQLEVRPDPFKEEIGPSKAPTTTAFDELERHVFFLNPWIQQTENE